jgi:hypothetical protein
MERAASDAVLNRRLAQACGAKLRHRHASALPSGHLGNAPISTLADAAAGSVRFGRSCRPIRTRAGRRRAGVRFGSLGHTREPCGSRVTQRARRAPEGPRAYVTTVSVPSSSLIATSSE